MSYGLLFATSWGPDSLQDITVPVTGGSGLLVSGWGAINEPASGSWAHNHNLCLLSIESPGSWRLRVLVGNCGWSGGAGDLNTNTMLDIWDGSNWAWIGDYSGLANLSGNLGFTEADLKAYQGTSVWVKADAAGMSIYQWTSLQNSWTILNDGTYGYTASGYISLATLRENAVTCGVSSAIANAWSPATGANLVVSIGMLAGYDAGGGDYRPQSVSHVKAKAQATLPTLSAVDTAIRTFTADTGAAFDLELIWGSGAPVLTDRSGHGLNGVINGGTLYQGVQWDTAAALDASPITVTPRLGQPGLGQVWPPSVTPIFREDSTDLTPEMLIDDGRFRQAAKIVNADLWGASIQALTALGLSVTPALGTPALGQTFALVASGLTINPALGTPTLAQVANQLEALGLSVMPALGSPTLAQRFDLVALSPAVVPVLGTPTIAQAFALVASGVKSTPALGTPALGQTFALTANPITVAPALGQPATGQTFALTAQGLSVVPALGQPGISQGGNQLTALPLSVSPGLGSPTLAQSFDLAALGLSMQPALGSPVAGQVFALVALGITVTPHLGQPGPDAPPVTGPTIVEVYERTAGGDLVLTARAVGGVVTLVDRAPGGDVVLAARLVTADVTLTPRLAGGVVEVL